MLLGMEVMRATHRNSFVNPEPLQPSQVTSLSFHIWDKFHTFKKGHRIMVQAHSSQFPANNRNPQQFMDIYQAEAGDYTKAVQNIYKSTLNHSHLTLPVMTARRDMAVRRLIAKFARWYPRTETRKITLLRKIGSFIKTEA